MHADRHGLEGGVDLATETTVIFSLPLCVCVYIYIYIYIYFFLIKLIHFWLRWVFVAAAGLSLVAESRGFSL